MFSTPNHITYTTRAPKEEDAQAIMDFARVLFASTDQVLTTLEEYTITLEEEKKWINRPQTEPCAFILIAEADGKVIGLLDFATRPRKKAAHTGEFGVSVHPDYQGRGIGRMLIENLLVWAKTNTQVEKVFLNVMATNQRAIRLYKRLGFLEEGRHVKAVKQKDGQYVDLIQMYLETIS